MSILLRCTTGGSDKEYWINRTSGELLSAYGPTGKLSAPSSKGPYSDREALKLLQSKIKKGYEIITVLGKPFMGTDIQAIQALSSGSFSTVSQAPQAKVEVSLDDFSFNEEVISPIW